jgi:hypothetical protein
VVVERPARDARRREDRVDRGGLVAVLAEQGAPGGEQPLARLPALLDPAVGHGFRVNRPMV